MPRATASLLGAVLLVGVTMVLAAALAVVATGFAPMDPGERVLIEAAADSTTGRVTLEHAGGPPLDVDGLSVRVAVDGEPLTHQPPVPFYAAAGFNGFPTGPFNPAADQRWSAGETATFRVAKTTNAPPLKTGSELTVTLSREGQLVARTTVTVR